MNRGRYKIRVTSSKRQFFTENSVRYLAISEAGLRQLAFAGLFLLCCAGPAAAQAAPATPQTMPAAGQPAPDPQAPGTIQGTVVDKSGAALVGAVVKVTRGDQALAPDVQTDDNGQYSFTKIAPGAYQVSVSANGFTTVTSSGTLNPSQAMSVPAITLEIAGPVTKVTVEPPKVELAEIQINEEEHQRVLGFVPNFYVSYIPDATPLDTKQKFELAWRSSVDPVTFGIAAAVAGLEQAVATPNGWGQDAAGYGQRYGAFYAEDVTSTFLGDFLLPSIFHQDPRYFYKGTGSTRSRVLYAIANAVICKGDNKKWQFNYSYVIGSLAASGIANSYYPPKDRGVGLTFENSGIGIAGTAAANILQEFVVRKLTPNLPKLKSDKD
jgi:Carboxypeptidase regulatory-like domain